MTVAFRTEQRLDRRQAQRHRVFDLQIRIASATENARPARMISTMPAFGGRADMTFCAAHVRF